MRIAIIGIRGIPVTYSAFETFAETFSLEMNKRGHDVTVYCRSKYVKRSNKKYLGIKRIILPNLERKNFGTLTHSLLSTLHACFYTRYDVVLYLGVGSCPFSILPRIIGTKTVVHIDGLDWKRKKWGYIGRNYLKAAEYLSSILPNLTLTDSEFMREYYKKTYKKTISYIPYGYFKQSSSNLNGLLKKYNIVKSKYFVWVGRLVPENLLEEFLESFMRLRKDVKCVIVGDVLYNSSYKKYIYENCKKDSRIIRTGFISHEDTLKLVSNSLAYIETKRSGGTHVSLVEAMGSGTLIISNDNEANKGVLKDNALFYSSKTRPFMLLSLLEKVCNAPKKYNILRLRVKRHAEINYEWENVINQYENLLAQILSPTKSQSTFVRK